MQRQSQRGGTNRDYILNIINPVTLESSTVKYVIQNPESKFVVVTYWWGRDNGNKNLGRPCPPHKQVEGTPMTTYDQMIEGPGGWLETCKAAGVNYMAVEYNQFHIDKKYQEAINAKPYFIKKALELCNSRAVLYIDGDMTVNRYPAIFDIQDVDFMGRNWNCDPRSKDTYEDSPGADFYTFETSGGIMYFGQTKQAHSLLDAWIQATELPGMEKKADDRILSLIFNNLRMYLPLNIIQLPIEYLWLSMIYGSKPLDGASRAHLEGVYSKALTEAAAERESAVDEKAVVAAERSINRLRRELLAIRKGFVDMSPMKIIRNGKVKYEDPWSYVFIEHPHCLTPEEVAREKSNATVNRQPVTYNRNVTESIGFRGGGWFHDYIFFDSEEQAKAFVPYQYYADTHTLYEDEYYNENTNTEEVDEVPLFYHERYADRYGRFNAIAAENDRLVLRLDRQTYKSPPSRTTECPAGEFTLSPPCKVIKNSTIPQILYYLQKGIDVLYVPPRAQPSYIKAVIKEAEEGNNQLITVNVSTMKPTSKPHDLKSEYRLTIPLDAPIYFGSRSKVLQHLLRMCRNLEDLPKLFNSSIVFLTRIRCKWVAATSSGATSIPAAAIINQTGSEVADALVNPESAAEQTAIIQTLPALITEQIPERGTNIQSVVITNLANKIKGIKLGGRRRRRRSQKMDTIRFLTKTRKNLRGRRVRGRRA